MSVQDCGKQIAVRQPGQGWSLLLHITEALKCFSRALLRWRIDPWLEGLPGIHEECWNLPEIKWQQDYGVPSVDEAGGVRLSEPRHELKAEEEVQHRKGSASASTPGRRFKGIRRATKSTSSWVTEIRPTNAAERIWLGSYPTPEQAARAFDVGTFYCNKKKKQYNFPDSVHNLPSCEEINRLPARQQKRRIQELARQVATLTR
ncbi:hypothetical protein CY35_11G040400 [Sphagnum magellanicum]|jgi:hypothetical protein|nr:hypothetical protein CY35_11G040400 [Sphagnum magellanicum]